MINFTEKGCGMKKGILVSLLFALTWLASSVCFATSSNQSAIKYKKVITVGQHNNQFKDVQSAYDSVVGASYEDPVLIKIMPGTYEFTQLSLSKDYIDIEGSGKGITILKSVASNYEQPSVFFVAATAQTEIRDLSVDIAAQEGTTGHYTTAFYIDGSMNTTLRNVAIVFNDQNSDYSTGIRVRKLWGAAAIFENVTLNMSSNSSSSYINGADLLFGYMIFDNFSVVVNGPNSPNVTAIQAKSGLLQMTNSTMAAYGSANTTAFSAWSDYTYAATFSLSQCQLTGIKAITTSYATSRLQNDTITVSDSIIDGQVLSTWKSVLSLNACVDPRDTPVIFP